MMFCSMVRAVHAKIFKTKIKLNASHSILEDDDTRFSYHAVINVTVRRKNRLQGIFILTTTQTIELHIRTYARHVGVYALYRCTLSGKHRK